jgi:hypothetical protein
LGWSARWAGSIDPFYMTFVVQKHPLLTTTVLTQITKIRGYVDNC